MKDSIRNSLLAWLATAAWLLAGCASQPATPRAVFAKLTINGQPVHMALDTGAASTVLYSSAANRVGLDFAPPRQDVIAGKFEIVTGMSGPARVAAGARTFTSRLPVFTLPPSSVPGEDGVIGWPEVRDNILIFDGAHRMVHSAAQLPQETSGWLKLKMRPHATLLLETPLSNGKTGVILVDTGAPQGVQLAPAQLQEFKTAHPETPSTAVTHSSWSIGSFTGQTMWADEIKLGALVLTDVPVENMPDAEVALLNKAAPDDEVAGVIGMSALSRMDLVVDGKNGFACLRPKPRSASPGPTGFGNWNVAENVSLNCDNLLVRSGIDFCSSGRYDDAIADYTRALGINPDNPDAYASRALARQIRGDFSDALADYDKYIELNPDGSVGARLLRQALLLQLGHPQEDFLRMVAAWKSGWAKTIGYFLAGQLDEQALLEAAEKRDVVPVLYRQCEAFYYIGMMRLCKGDKAGAQDCFQKCVDTGVREYAEYQFAAAKLAHPDSIR